MPSIPRLDGPTVGLSAPSTPAYTGVSTNADTGLEALGQSVTGLGKVLDTVALQADDLRAQEAFNRLQEKKLDLTVGQQNGFMQIKGGNVLKKDENNNSLSTRYISQFDDAQNEIGQQLGNERQRQIFSRLSGGARLQFQNGVMGHEQQQVEEHAKSVYNGTVDMAALDAKANWNNKNIINQSIALSEKAIQDQGRMLGWDPRDVNAISHKKISLLLKDSIQQALDSKNYLIVQEHLHTYSSMMDVNDTLKLRSTMNEEVELATSHQLAVKTFDKVTAGVTPSAMRVLSSELIRADGGVNVLALNKSVRNVESGGKDYNADGSVVRPIDPKTGKLLSSAEGAMQVLKGTARDPGYGVTPARNNSVEERTRVGEEYSAALVVHYRGDVVKAVAAYGWGPGQVDKAIKNHGNAWFDSVPADKQQYVAKVLAPFQERIAAPARVATEEDHLNAVRADPIYQRLSVKGKEAVERVTKDRVSTHQRSTKETGENTYAEAIRRIDSGVLFDDLPASFKGQIPAEKFGALREYERNVRGNGKVETNWEFYTKYDTNPGALKDVNLLAHKHELDTPEYKHLLKLQKEIKSGNDTHLTAVYTQTQVLDNLFDQVGITTADRNTKNGARKVGQLRSQLQQNVNLLEATKKNKLTPKEFAEEAAKLFTSKKVGNFWTSEKSWVELDPANDKIPEDARVALVKSYRNNGIAQPTEEQLMAAYIESTGR